MVYFYSYEKLGEIQIYSLKISLGITRFWFWAHFHTLQDVLRLLGRWLNSIPAALALEKFTSSFSRRRALTGNTVLGSLFPSGNASVLARNRTGILHHQVIYLSSCCAHAKSTHAGRGEEKDVNVSRGFKWISDETLESSVASRPIIFASRAECCQIRSPDDLARATSQLNWTNIN